MGTIKLEIDIPEFEKELNINVTIRRDGEVLLSTSSPSMGNSEREKEIPRSGQQTKNLVEEKKSDWPTAIPPGNANSSPKPAGKPTITGGLGGNLMGMEI